jgi:hypothetical protein
MKPARRLVLENQLAALILAKGAAEVIAHIRAKLAFATRNVKPVVAPAKAAKAEKGLPGAKGGKNNLAKLKAAKAKKTARKPAKAAKAAPNLAWLLAATNSIPVEYRV